MKYVPASWRLAAMRIGRLARRSDESSRRAISVRSPDAIAPKSANSAPSSDPALEPCCVATRTDCPSWARRTSPGRGRSGRHVDGSRSRCDTAFSHGIERRGSRGWPYYSLHIGSCERLCIMTDRSDSEGIRRYIVMDLELDQQLAKIRTTARAVPSHTSVDMSETLLVPLCPDQQGDCCQRRANLDPYPTCHSRVRIHRRRQSRAPLASRPPRLVAGPTRQLLPGGQRGAIDKRPRVCRTGSSTRLAVADQIRRSTTVYSRLDPRTPQQS
jgi:hypothetical protein